jgi:F-type H+-transporting ATPase subunit epsilon
VADSRLFTCTVVTPERVVLERQARFVAVPAHDGEVGFLRHRSPLIVKLDVGSLRVESDAGSEELFIDGGFAEMLGDRLTVLTEEAIAPENLDLEQARAELEEARAASAVDDEAWAQRQHALRRARAQLRMLGK